MNIDSGIIVIDKPKDITSFKAVSLLKSFLRIKRVGHMGTLDPMATGVLPIMLGFATKALSLIENHDKKYLARMKFGISSDTQDITGNIIKSSTKKVFLKDVEEVLRLFIGRISQIPPMYSAIKKNGVKLYTLARLGKSIERDKRSIYISSIRIIEFDEYNQTMSICVECSGGTYIRTLCSDIGEKLECGAVMTYLRRLESNGFNLNDSLSIDEVKTLCDIGGIDKKIFPIDYLFKNLDKISITYPQAIRFKNGGGLSFDRLENFSFKNNIFYKVYLENTFIGIGAIDVGKQELSVLKVFNRNI